MDDPVAIAAASAARRKRLARRGAAGLALLVGIVAFPSPVSAAAFAALAVVGLGRGLAMLGLFLAVTSLAFFATASRRPTAPPAPDDLTPYIGPAVPAAAAPAAEPPRGS